MSEVRVRFAPSPTGYLHMGGVRTALYNYLFAKKHGGKFILRIEDTDQNRFVEEAENYIRESLNWCGIIPDEDDIVGGEFAPYKQSERGKIYDKYIKEILSTDFAYIAFDTVEELETIRLKHEAEDKFFSYNQLTRNYLKNSLTMSKEEVDKKIKNGDPYVVRFKVPSKKILLLNDIIRGNFSIDSSTLDDKVLVKADGIPTYHFANIVDDHTMKISHVIRGEEWLPSMGLHVLLYEAFGWKSPKFAHLPLILKPEGKGKLSKRDGDKFGFPVFPLAWENKKEGTSSIGYREEGYFPETFINMLALLGWTPSNNKEKMSMEELISEFDLNKVHKSGARFNPQKTIWLNHQYLIEKNNQEILPLLEKELKKNNIICEKSKNLEIISMFKERIKFVKDIWNEGHFFWVPPHAYNEKNFKKIINQDTKELLESFVNYLNNINFNKEEIDKSIHSFIEKRQIGFGKLMQPLRLAIVGELKGPEMADIINIIGKEESLNRINKLIYKI